MGRKSYQEKIEEQCKGFIYWAHGTQWAFKAVAEVEKDWVALLLVDKGPRRVTARVTAKMKFNSQPVTMLLHVRLINGHQCLFPSSEAPVGGTDSSDTAQEEGGEWDEDDSLDDGDGGTLAGQEREGHRRIPACEVPWSGGEVPDTESGLDLGPDE